MSNIIEQASPEKQDEHICILCEGQHGHNLMCEYTEVDHVVL